LKSSKRIESTAILLGELVPLLKPYKDKRQAAHARFIADLVVRGQYRIFSYLSSSQLNALLMVSETRHKALQSCVRTVNSIMCEWNKVNAGSLFYFSYSHVALYWLGPVALRDPLVVQTLITLDLGAHWEGFPLHGRLYMKRLLEKLLNPTAQSLRGRKTQPTPEELLAEFGRVQSLLSDFKTRYRNRNSAKLTLEERFPKLPQLVINQIVGKDGRDELGRYSKRKITLVVLAETYGKKPRTVENWIIKAKRQAKLPAYSKILPKKN